MLVVGADRGIGEAVALEAAERGDEVVAACLGDHAGLRARGVRVEAGVDVTSGERVRALGERLRGVALDVIAYVAGVYAPGKLGSFDYEAMRREYEVNALGALRVVEALRDEIVDGGKIAIVTSRVGSIGENGSGGLYGYRMSKAAANMAVVCLARDLAKRGIAVVALHPGTVRTAMTASLTSGDASTAGTFVEPRVAARGLLARIDELTLAETATFRHANGERLAW